MSRAETIQFDGGEVFFPPTPHANYLVNCIHACGLMREGHPITALELQAWSSLTAAPLGPIDFQDLLDAARIYVAAYHRYDKNPVPPPWEPEEEDEEAIRKRNEAEERLFDRLMGIGN